METAKTASDSRQLPISTMTVIRHRELLIRAVANVTSSPVAKQTYAQIVDGLPLSKVADDGFDGCSCPGHPLDPDHTQLCPGVAEETEALCSRFDANALLMPSQLLVDYESTPLDSPGFATRLIELVARSVHQMAVWLYKQDTNRHKDDALGTWRPSEKYGRFYPATFPTTLFCHPWYRDYDQYPQGIADSVGYWAEARIIGGVVLFDRKNPDSDAVYIHADRRSVTYRICRLLDSQVEELARFLLSEPNPTASAQPKNCALPIRLSQANRDRVDPEQAIETTGINRDPWERRLRPLRETDLRTRDVIDTFNFLSKEDWRAAKKRAIRERDERERLEEHGMRG
ncbi:hypothetical protein BT67DRAFT_445079 [Trichocladium antarcticum]|uniref:Uncharacterized protein n=1 Tax=Trichocladium antarcticum TaxID=1450529 RepID=A0AAN6UDN4_9PEZI|nr:hypothetical protein BT67DRAFT_445079 [Trichocladium antarcticum]